MQMRNRPRALPTNHLLQRARAAGCNYPIRAHLGTCTAHGPWCGIAHGGKSGHGKIVTAALSSGIKGKLACDNGRQPNVQTTPRLARNRAPRMQKRHELLLPPHFFAGSSCSTRRRRCKLRLDIFAPSNANLHFRCMLSAVLLLNICIIEALCRSLSHAAWSLVKQLQRATCY